MKKYPKTYHAPWSGGISRDDKVISSMDNFIGKRVVVTEKMDGENVTMYSDWVHPRSLEYDAMKKFNSWMKAFHASVKYMLIPGYRYCGEYLYAEHSIRYDGLPNYFIGFNIINGYGMVESFDDMFAMYTLLCIPTAPVLYDGIYNEELIKECFTGNSMFGGEQEGYVIRIAEAFPEQDFPLNVAKFVRKNHVQTDAHWKYSELSINGLKK